MFVTLASHICTVHLKRPKYSLVIRTINFPYARLSKKNYVISGIRATDHLLIHKHSYFFPANIRIFHSLLYFNQV